MNDFRRYATGHLGMNGMVLDDVYACTGAVSQSIYS